jgi:hypothetical protein
VSRSIKVAGGGVLIAILGLLVLFFVDIEAVFRDREMRPPADACRRLDFNQRRCDAVIARAIEGAGVRAADVASIELGRPEGQKIGLGGSLVALARLRLVNGDTIDQEVWCIGVQSGYTPWCSNDPRIELSMGANHDVPCSGDDPLGTPEGCATPIALDPEAVAEARPLLIDSIDLPVTVGHHEVELGHATLPNGFLAEATFTLADIAPDGVVIPEGIHLVVTSTDPSRPPFGNVYERGRFPGVEDVVGTLVFDVVEAPPDAVLQVREVVVR